MPTFPVPHHRLVVTATICALISVGAPTAAPATTAATPSDDHVNQVLAVSVDGLNPVAIRELGPERAPNLHRLMAEGASTLNARTAVENTSTLPNHTGMLTSRRVNEDRGGHGVSFNDDDDRTTVHAAAGHYVASIFDVAHDRGRRTALYTSKDKFALYNRSWNRRHGATDAVGRDNGRDKIDTFVYRSDEDALVDLTLADLADGAPAFTFVHLSRTDKVGHEQGYMGAGYVDAVADADARLGRLLRLIESTPALRDHLAVVLTSDHGGEGRSHRDQRDPANYTVPLMVWGSGVATGADLYALNPGFHDPGTGRPGYRADPQPLRNAVLANLAADLLDLPPVPGSGIDAHQTMMVLGD